MLRLSLMVSLTFALACGDSHTVDVDSGSGGRDAGTTETDAGTGETDAGTGENDAGSSTCPGESPICLAGVCCSTRVEGTWGEGCAAVCPGESSVECEPSPLADCALPWWACQDNSDCTLRPAGCCYPCGSWSADDFDGVDVEETAQHMGLVCAEPVPCPRCATMPDPNVYAACSPDEGPYGTCRARDLRADPAIVGCTSSDECRIRAASCCECGADTSISNLVAVRRGAPIEDALCDAGQACDECAPTYPAEVSAYCNLSRGVCELAIDG